MNVPGTLEAGYGRGITGPTASWCVHLDKADWTRFWPVNIGGGPDVAAIAVGYSKDDAKAIAAELARRWNAHEALVKAATRGLNEIAHLLDVIESDMGERPRIGVEKELRAALTLPQGDRP